MAKNEDAMEAHDNQHNNNNLNNLKNLPVINVINPLICNGCMKAITNHIHYQCLCCPDSDYCEDCFQSHSHHTLLRINSKLTNPNSIINDKTHPLSLLNQLDLIEAYYMNRDKLKRNIDGYNDSDVNAMDTMLVNGSKTLVGLMRIFPAESNHLEKQAMIIDQNNHKAYHYHLTIITRLIKHVITKLMNRKQRSRMWRKVMKLLKYSVILDDELKEELQEICDSKMKKDRVKRKLLKMLEEITYETSPQTHLNAIDEISLKSCSDTDDSDDIYKDLKAFNELSIESNDDTYKDIKSFNDLSIELKELLN